MGAVQAITYPPLPKAGSGAKPYVIVCDDKVQKNVFAGRGGRQRDATRIIWKNAPVHIRYDHEKGLGFNTDVHTSSGWTLFLFFNKV